MAKFASVLKDERGATAVEYGLIAGLVVIAIFGTVSAVASSTISMWNDVSRTVEESVSGS